MNQLKLRQWHLDASAKMMDFGGWEMPVQYPKGILEEHEAVRKRVGLFDISHMGEFVVKGKDALSYLHHSLSNQFFDLEPGMARYTLLMNEAGGIEDDLIVYRRKKDYLLIVNAGNTEKDFEILCERCGSFDVTIENETDAWCLFALQGPRAVDVVRFLGVKGWEELGYFHCLSSTEIKGKSSIFATRTGYTGEDGFEIMLPCESALEIWEALMEGVKKFNGSPVGLGARDSLRVEAALPLYGHEIDVDVQPAEASLNWVVAKEKGDFIGKACLDMVPRRKRVGFRMLSRRVPRNGYDLKDMEGLPLGTVTSGTFSPCFQEGIGIGLVDASFQGKELQIDIRGKRSRVEVMKLPFYKRQK